MFMITSSKDLVEDSPSLISSRSRADSRYDIDGRAIQDFKHDIEDSYLKSVANKIYSFPLHLQYCASLVSSDDSSLDAVEDYHLDAQNKKYKELERSFEAKRSRSQKKKAEILHKAQIQKMHVRHESSLIRKKYKQLVRVVEKSMSPNKKNLSPYKLGPYSKGRQSKDKQHISYFQVESKQAKEGKETQMKQRPHSNRLKTEPDESMGGTFRKMADFKFKQLTEF